MIAKIPAQNTYFPFRFTKNRHRQSMDKPKKTAANSVSVLKSGKAKAIRFSTPEEICKILNCQPGDILEYMNDEDYEKLIGR